MVHRIYPVKLQLNANASDTEAAFSDLNLPIYNDTVSTKLYDKQDDFNFGIANFPFLECNVFPARSHLWCIYFSPIRQAHPFVWQPEIFLSRLVVSLLRSIIVL